MTRVTADSNRWVRYTWFAILAITGFRVLMLALGKTELYLDEEQYWLWGQHPDFGYFSKPPLIGWLIGAVTALSGSDTPFWVRLPAPLLHGVTAYILGFWARTALLVNTQYRHEGAFWIALAYLTLPITTVGSFVISTDTVMAPFFAGALITYWKLVNVPSPRMAVITGVLVGLAMLAKYAGVYFFVFAIIAAIFIPKMRVSPKYFGLALFSTFIVLTPNIYWNIVHDFATIDHTAGNASWGSDDGLEIDPLRIFEFLVGQAIVLGPIFLIVLLINFILPRRSDVSVLIAFSLPVFLIVGAQSFLADVNANWTFSGCMGATALSVIWLLQRGARRALIGAIALNCCLMFALPLLTLAPEKFTVGDKPILARYMGRSDMAAQVFTAAAQTDATAILAENRGILADLFFYSDPAAGLPIYSPSYSEDVRHYFAQTFPLPSEVQGPVLFVSRASPKIQCFAPLVATFKTAGGAYQGRPAPKAFLLSAECLDEVTKDD